jgi:uncharacterized sulfatase
MTHILFIILDTQRRDRLSLYGYRRPTSPRLDAFASRATVFDRAISPAQWTVPAHASLFTGVYPHIHQMTQASHTLPAALPALAELLRLKGYHTTAFCNNPLVGILDNGLQRGFNAFYNYAGASPNRAYARRWPGLLGSVRRWFHRTARAASNRFAHSDTLFRLSLLPLFTSLWTRTVNYKGSTPRTTRDVAAYWHQHVRRSRQPLFVFVNLMGTHMPLRPPQRTLDALAPDLRRSRASYRWMNDYNNNGLRWISPLEAPLEDWQQAALDAFYDAEAAEQDRHLGDMLATMQRQGDLENTLVVIGADHGEGLGDHGYMGHSFVVHHELVHVPWIMWHQERFREGRVPQVVSTRRVFHTLLDMADAGDLLPRDNPNYDVQRLSLARSLGDDDPEDSTAFSEAHPAQTLLRILERRAPARVAALRLAQVRRSITQGDHKVLLAGDHLEAAYNLASDPAETNNLLPQSPPWAVPLADAIRRTLAAPTASAAPRDFSPEVLENLRALGYIE